MIMTAYLQAYNAVQSLFTALAVEHPARESFTKRYCKAHSWALHPIASEGGVLCEVLLQGRINTTILSKCT